MTYDEPWQAQLDYLLATLRAEMATGGRLVAFKTLSEVDAPEGELTVDEYPVLSCQFDSASEDGTGSTAGPKIKSSFTIAIYTTVAFAGAYGPDATSDPVKAVEAAARNLWNDRKGNGVGPVLREDRTLGGLVTMSYPSQLRIASARASNEAAGTAARFACTFNTQAELRI